MNRRYKIKTFNLNVTNSQEAQKLPQKQRLVKLERVDNVQRGGRIWDLARWNLLTDHIPFLPTFRACLTVHLAFQT